MRGRATGFTLIELLVGMSIMSIMSVMMYGGLQNVLDVGEYTEHKSADMRALQSALIFVQNDLEQAIDRPIRDRLGDEQAALVARPKQRVALSLTVLNRGLEATDYRRSRLQRIDYRFEGGALYRDSWNVLDRAHESAPQSRQLMSEIEALSWRYYGRKWETFWPLNSIRNEGLPMAIELTFTLKGYGQIRRLFLLPGKVA